MLNPEHIARLGEQILGLLPEGAQQAKQDLDKNLHSLLQSSFAKLDLISRSEFDAQAAVLLRTRQRLEELEARLAELELAELEQAPSAGD